MRTKLFTILIIISSLLVSCGDEVKPKEHLGEIYSVALDSMMGLDQALNHDMKYIAIDMSSFDELDEKDRGEIISYFEEKYDVEIKNATFEQLQEQGLFNPDTLSLDGVLLKIEKVDFKLNNKVFFVGSKYRSGLGAIGVEITVRHKDGEWRVEEVKTTWVS